MTTVEYTRDSEGKTIGQRAPLYVALAQTLQQYRNCEESGNTEWLYRSSDLLDQLCRDHLPSGSGLDSGTHFDRDRSNATKLVFSTEYHHMNDVGMYDGWTDHVVTVTPSFDGIDIKISGRDRNQIKDWLYEVFEIDLTKIVDF